MKLLLTSGGISNPSIRGALVDLLGKPIDEASALFVPTAIYPFPGGGAMAWKAAAGASGSPLVDLGWRSMGLLELTALPSIGREAWVPTLEDTDAVLVYGGDPLFLAYWLKESGFADLLPSLPKTVYVGVSAGSIAAAGTFGETYVDPPAGTGTPLAAEKVVFSTPEGDLDRLVVTAHGMGVVDFAVIPHLDSPSHPDASLPNAEVWAGKLPVPTYALDDQSAVKVTDDTVEVVSEGHWKLFPA